MKILFLPVLLSLSLIGQTLYSQKAGDPAPDFTLQTVDGVTFQLSQHPNKVIMILFFGYNCPICLAGDPSVQSDIVSKYSSNQDFLAIGVDAWDGSKSGVRSFRTSTGLKMDMCLMGSSIETLYGLTGWDRVVIVDKEGNIAYKGDADASQTIKPAKAAIDAALNGSSSDTTMMTTAVNNTKTDRATRVTVYPNPIFNNATISFELDQPSIVNIQVRSIGGKILYEKQAGYYASGRNKIPFDAGNLRGGVYYLILRATGQTEVSKFVVY